MNNCEFPKENPTSSEIKQILNTYKTVAIVGISTDETKDSYRVAKFLKENGYKIIPINPKYKEILGEICYPDLKSVPEHIGIVDIFRKPDAIPSVVDEAIEVKADVVWMQLGLTNNEAAEKARNACIKVVMNKCTKIEVMNL